MDSKSAVPNKRESDTQSRNSHVPASKKRVVFVGSTNDSEQKTVARVAARPSPSALNVLAQVDAATRETADALTEAGKVQEDVGCTHAEFPDRNVMEGVFPDPSVLASLIDASTDSSETVAKATSAIGVQNTSTVQVPGPNTEPGIPNESLKGMLTRKKVTLSHKIPRAMNLSRCKKKTKKMFQAHKMRIIMNISWCMKKTKTIFQAHKMRVIMSVSRWMKKAM